MPPLITIPAAGLSPLPSTFDNANNRPTLRYQGAEALVYYMLFPTSQSQSSQNLKPFPAFLKHRPRKTYRHPILDAKLTKHRILAEARVLARLRRDGVHVPALYALDWDAGWMIGEWIEGDCVRAVLDNVLPAWILEVDQGITDSTLSLNLTSLMRRIGSCVGRMHDVSVVHGDLTTSNLLLRLPHDHQKQELPTGVYDSSLQGDVYMIDFGLAQQSSQDEDRAVDLYVLERTFGSSHPQTEQLYEELLNAYSDSYKGAKAVVKRLAEVRLRGRKKIMIG